MILVFGVAGSGKSTQSELLAELEGWHWVSMGQLFRNNIQGDLREAMNQGKLMEDSIAEQLLDTELQKLENKKMIVLDGFPRRIAQAEWLMQSIGSRGDSIQAVIHISANQEVVRKRLLQRGRTDDKPDAITERFYEYEQVIKPLLDLFRQKAIPVIEVNGEQTPAEVQRDIRNSLQDNGVITS